jgi:twitching motility protein PilI
MSDFGHKHPIQLLYEIEQLSMAAAKGLPQQVDIKESWSGICFRVNEINLVAPLNQVSEILHFPTLTMVPGTKSWVKGVANVRGMLLPVMDLNGYLGKKATTLTQKTRILVTKFEDMTVGVVVDEVIGLKHFSDEDKVTAVKKFDESVRNYIQGAFRQNEVETLVFNMHALAMHPQFFQVAV